MQIRTSLSILVAIALAFFSNDCFSVSLVSGEAELAVEGRTITITKGEKEIIRLNAIAFNYSEASEWEVVRANESQIVVFGRFPAAVDFYRNVQDQRVRTVELTISKRPDGFRLYANPTWGRQVSLDLEYLGDHFFGLSEPLQPDNRLSPDLTGASIRVEIESEGESLRENYATAYSPLYMSSFGYGAFFDTFARGRYDFAINGGNRIHHDTGTLDWHILLGEDGRDIHQAYFALVGKPKPVPAWGLGPIGWRDHNEGAAEILADVERMSALRIPFTSWFVDRPYSDGVHGWSEMNFSQAFASPGEWIGTLREDYGLEFMTWTTPATFGDTRFEKHLAGKFSYLDLSHPQSVQAYQDELKREQHAYGVRGHKIDRADEGFPAFEEWHDTSVLPAERRNRYAYLMAKIHDEVLRASWGDDQITFARAAIHRSQPYLSAIWGGDPRTSWEGLRSNFANAARSAFIGFPVWGTDVGGYQGEGYIPEDLYIRWMQAGSMTGLFEIKLDGAGGEGRDRMPWRYDDEFQELFREICEDRMRLIPYLYSLSRTSAETGTLMQPLAYRHLDDNNTYDNWDQFYVGDAILVAPVFAPGVSRKVYLPEGEWRDFDNPARRYRGGQVVGIDAPLDKLPRFVKENSVYVTGNIYKGNDRRWDTAEPELAIHAFPGRTEGSKSLFTYVDMVDGNARKEIELVREKQQVHLTSPAMLHRTRVDILLEQKPQAVQLNGQAAAVDYSPTTNTLSIMVPQGRRIDVEVAL